MPAIPNKKHKYLSLVKNGLLKIISYFLQPILVKVKSYLSNIIQLKVQLLIDQQESFTTARFEQIKGVIFEISDKQHQLIDVLEELRPHRSENVLNNIHIANGLIDAESYLEKSLVNEKMNLQDLKRKYGENAFYYLFEKLFRGSESEISIRQSFYLSFIKECFDKVMKNSLNGAIFDFGCGRGELLKLLKNMNIPVVGVDTSQLNCDWLASQGLNAVCEDGTSFLGKQSDNSLCGLTMFQVAEHLEYESLKKIIDLAYKKILPGGIIIIETVNPSCDFSMRYFYLDPTHIRPYPPETLKFYSEWVGFINLKIIYYSPINQHIQEDDLTNYVGYALIGYKPDSSTLN